MSGGASSLRHSCCRKALVDEGTDAGRGERYSVSSTGQSSDAIRIGRTRINAKTDCSVVAVAVAEMLSRLGGIILGKSRLPRPGRASSSGFHFDRSDS